MDKYPPTGRTERYRDVLPLPLAGMFSGRSGRPETIGGDEDPNEADSEGGYQWESHPSSESSAKEEEEKDKDVQELSADESGQGAPETGSGQLDQILESISNLASSVAIL